MNADLFNKITDAIKGIMDLLTLHTGQIKTLLSIIEEQEKRLKMMEVRYAQLSVSDSGKCGGSC